MSSGITTAHERAPDMEWLRGGAVARDALDEYLDSVIRELVFDRSDHTGCQQPAIYRNRTAVAYYAGWYTRWKGKQNRVFSSALGIHERGTEVVSVDSTERHPLHALACGSLPADGTREASSRRFAEAPHVERQSDRAHAKQLLLF